MNLVRPTLVAIVLAMLVFVPVAADDKAQREPTLRDVLLRLGALANRIEQLDQRILRLERKIGRRPIQVDKHGIIRNEKGHPVGIWGVDADRHAPGITPNRR